MNSLAENAIDLDINISDLMMLSSGEQKFDKVVTMMKA